MDFGGETDNKVGLQRTDNNMDITSWPQVSMINQKNYYTQVSPKFSILDLQSFLGHRRRRDC